MSRTGHRHRVHWKDDHHHHDIDDETFVVEHMHWGGMDDHCHTIERLGFSIHEHEIGAIEELNHCLTGDPAMLGAADGTEGHR